MIAIWQEICDIEGGRAEDRQSAYPAGLDGDKYWCPVNRIDNAYGDRHPICNCAPPADWGAAAE
jgi:hypothetical protein